MSKDLESIVAAILDVEKRFLKGEYGEGETADEAAVEAVEKILLDSIKK